MICRLRGNLRVAPAAVNKINDSLADKINERKGDCVGELLPHQIIQRINRLPGKIN